MAQIKKRAISSYRLKALDLHLNLVTALVSIQKMIPVLWICFLKKSNWDPEEIVTVNKQGDVRTLKEALISHFEITVLTKPLLEQAAQLSGK